MGLTEQDVVTASEVEYRAISWRVVNESYLRIHQSHPHSRIVIYERLLSGPAEGVAEILQFLSLAPDKQVDEFLRKSMSANNVKTRVLRDASSDYFSVFKGSEFDRNAWKRVLSASEVKVIDYHTGQLVRQLGLDSWCVVAAE
jgi:hypothetical protein